MNSIICYDCLFIQKNKETNILPQYTLSIPPAVLKNSYCNRICNFLDTKASQQTVDVSRRVLSLFVIF